MKLGPVTKLDMRIKITLKKFNDDVISKNYDIIVLFPGLWPIWSNPGVGFQKHSL